MEKPSLEEFIDTEITKTLKPNQVYANKKVFVDYAITHPLAIEVTIYQYGSSFKDKKKKEGFYWIHHISYTHPETGEFIRHEGDKETIKKVGQEINDLIFKLNKITIMPESLSFMAPIQIYGSKETLETLKAGFLKYIGKPVESELILGPNDSEILVGLVNLYNKN